MKCNQYNTKSGKPIRLWQGDCMELMQEDKEWDLAIVDPEYGLGIAKSGSLGQDSFKPKDWDAERVSKDTLNSIIKSTSNQIFWGYNYYSDLLPPCKGFIYWNKMNHHDNRADGELAWTSFDKLARHFEYMWDGNRYGFKNGKKNGVGEPTIRIHPTEKPVDLYRWLLTNYAEEGDTILDTHGGSMSLAIACYMEDYELDIIELDEDYYNDAVNRFEKHISQQVLF